MFKQGAFVNILTSDPNQWRSTLASLLRLPLLDHLELWLEHIPRGNELKEIKSAFRGVPLIIHGPFIHTSLLSHVPEIVKATERRFNEALEFASKVDAQVVTFHGGSYPLFESKADALEKLAARFEPFSKTKDPVATLENMPIKSYGTVKEPIGALSDYDEMLKLLPGLRLTLDVGHSLQNEDDFVGFIKKHSSRIENIHLHDGIPRGRGHLRLGSGTLDLASLLDVLVEVSFNKYVSMETIALEDTKFSWGLLRESESQKGIGNSDSRSRHELPLSDGESSLVRSKASFTSHQARTGRRRRGRGI
jgi:sugar phosphate isomerase/epimerase